MTEIDCFRYDGRILCVECGADTRDQYVADSGHPPEAWEGCEDETCLPVRAYCPEGAACAECGEPV